MSTTKTRVESPLSALVCSIFGEPERYEWTLQGFGMLRTYLPYGYRLHVWDSRYAVPGVSVVHTHPWDMESTVVAGSLTNHRYLPDTSWDPDVNLRFDPYLRQTIKCGEGGGLEGEPVPVRLFRTGPEIVPNRWGRPEYSQMASEIHSSHPEDGTVTIVRRIVPEGGDPDYAYVFWPEGEQWISAEPRRAIEKEVLDIIDASLARWF